MFYRKIYKSTIWRFCQTAPVWGATAGFLAGFGWSKLIFAIIALFEQCSWRYIVINGGFITVYFTLISFILGPGAGSASIIRR